ncbi:MAG: hypothetical protein WBI50_00315, partial [Acetomicrobium sp.]
MTNWNEAERIYAKLYKEGDITWEESDVIFKILHDYIFSKSLSWEDRDRSREFLKKWLLRIFDLTNCGIKGIFLHSIIHELRERFFLQAKYKDNYYDKEFLISNIEMNIRRNSILTEEKDKVVILTLKSKNEVSKLLNGKIPCNLAGRKYQKFDYEPNYSPKRNPWSYIRHTITDLYQKYFFEIYRPMTLERIGFDDYVDLEIDDEFFKSACKYYGSDVKVTSMSEVYERAIEILLDMGVPMYAYSITPFNSMLDSLFDMFVHKDYAQEA